MFNKTPGQSLKISRNDISNIKRISIEENFNRKINHKVDNSDYIFAVSNFEVKISKGSVVGIDSDKDLDFDFRAIDFLPPFDTNKLNKMVDYRYRQQLERSQIYNAVMPTYRNHQGFFGILVDDLEVDGGARVKIAGQSIARINIKNRVYLGPSFPDYLKLNPDIEYKIEGEENFIPLVYDNARDSKTDYGSTRLIHPTKIEKEVDEDTDPVTVKYYLPEGNQLAIVNLGGSSMDFWRVYLWNQGEKK